MKLAQTLFKMPYYRKVVVKYSDTEEKFICKYCDQDKGSISNCAKRHYKVHFKMIDGSVDNLCVVCASSVTNKPIDTFLEKARTLKAVK